MKTLAVELINFKTTKNYDKNLENMINFIEDSTADFILFPEAALTGFDYENWQKANNFGKTAIEQLSKIKKAFAFTVIKDNKNYFCFFDHGLVYKRAKYNLFGMENKYFKAGFKPEVFEWRGLKIASLICFELRFVLYWEQFKGIDIVLIPSRWGKNRIEHFKILNKALALSTQSEVMAVNSANECAYSCALNAWGEGLVSQNEISGTVINLNKNTKIRKKLDIGIK